MRTITRLTNHLPPLILLATAISITTICQAEEAEAQPSPFWGNAPGLTAPQPDSKGRAGHWWWPRPETGARPQRHVAGNRGRVFGAWEQPSMSIPEEAPVPPPAEPNVIGCGWPGLRLNNILFAFDQATLKPEGKAEINKLVAEMEKYEHDTLVCVGHTDDVGSVEYNFKLGEQRAQAVMDYMVGQGIAAKRVSIKSMGETQPAVPNDSRQNRALNRRVEFDITLGN